jgi:uncharacterized LabA/DUF88 family protein
MSLPGNYAVMVDAGFLKAEGARALDVPRDRCLFNGKASIDWFTRFAQDQRFAGAASVFAGKTFLRAYWYDAAFDPSDRRYGEQRAALDELALVHGLYLRLGYIQERRPAWQHGVRRALKACGTSLVDFEKHFEFRPELGQKGVDALITLDLVQLTRDRVVEAILLVSGDRDLQEAVRVAQGAGCRVVLAHPPRAGVSTALPPSR